MREGIKKIKREFLLKYLGIRAHHFEYLSYYLCASYFIYREFAKESDRNFPPKDSDLESLKQTYLSKQRKKLESRRKDVLKLDEFYALVLKLMQDIMEKTMVHPNSEEESSCLLIHNFNYWLSSESFVNLMVDFNYDLSIIYRCYHNMIADELNHTIQSIENYTREDNKELLKRFQDILRLVPVIDDGLSTQTEKFIGYLTAKVEEKRRNIQGGAMARKKIKLKNIEAVKDLLGTKYDPKDLSDKATMRDFLYEAKRVSDVLSDKTIINYLKEIRGS